MNTFLNIVWGLINPDMFAGVADTLEDVMKASVPTVIENVRVADIGQGSNPIRILSLRALPDSHVKELKDSIHEQNKKTKDPQEAAADEEGGDYYNLEASFAYHAAPSGAKDTSSKARNMHMQLVFYLGIKGLFGVPLPIFVELQSLVGTVRIRLQMTPQPPFLKNLTFTLMGVPQVSAGCIPMVQKGVNILNLPLISNFVNYAIGAAASMYVAPKSMALDLGAMLQGDDITKDVLAMGIMWIRIHRARGLSKQDRRGSKGGGSDPYITLSFSKYGKPMYCTRVITDDLNPIWEETCALIVTPEYIKADEQLSIELWDSDRSSADDIVGKGTCFFLSLDSPNVQTCVTLFECCNDIAVSSYFSKLLLMCEAIEVSVQKNISMLPNWLSLAVSAITYSRVDVRDPNLLHVPSCITLLISPRS